MKETLLDDIEKRGRFKFKNKKDYTRKAKRSDFSPKHGISERTISLAYTQVNLALSRIQTPRLGKHRLYFLSGTKATRKSDGTPVSLTTALTESGYGTVIGDIIQKGRGLGLRKMGFWVFTGSSDTCPISKPCKGSNGMCAAQSDAFVSVTADPSFCGKKCNDPGCCCGVAGAYKWIPGPKWQFPTKS